MRQKIAAKLEPCQTNSDTLCFLISSFLSVMGPDTSMLGGQLPSTAVVQVNQHRWNQKCYFKCIHFQSKFSHNFSQVWEFQHEHQKGKKQNVPTFLLLRLRWYVYVFMYMHLCIYICIYVLWSLMQKHINRRSTKSETQIQRNLRSAGSFSHLVHPQTGLRPGHPRYVWG